MSIHIVGQSTDYKNLNYNNTLYLNSSTDPQIIRLKTELNETYISYENAYNVGVKNNKFVFNDILNNKDLLSLNENDFNVYTKLNTFDDIQIQNLISTSNNYTFINSNLNINLYNGNVFSIKNINKNTILDVNSYNININSNVYINNGVLYVNKISSIGNNELEIKNASYTSAVIESMVFKKNLIIDNTQIDAIQNPNDIDNISIEINKYYKTKDIININNVLINNNIISEPVRVLTVNKDGFVGIGVVNPTAQISLSKMGNNNNIINYSGDNNGDKFYLNQYGNIGAGTNTPNGRLHLKRVDDYPGQHIRNHPILNLDMNYLENLNTSNVIRNYDTVYSDQNDDDVLNINIYNISTTDITNEFVFLSNSIFENLLQNIDNYPYFKNINQDNIIETQTFGKDDTTNPEQFYKINLKFFIPQLNPNIYLKNLNTYDNSPMRIIGTIVYYDLVLYTTTDLNIDPANVTDTNSGNFIKITFQPTLIKGKSSLDVKNYTLSLSLYVEIYKPSDSTAYVYTKSGFEYSLNYDLILPTVIPAPDIMYITSNNQYLSSISSKGTLSLGSPAPENSKYLLYSPGYCLINNLEVSNISSYNNLPVNVDSLYCSSYKAFSSISSNLYSSNLYSSNIYFETMGNSYVSFNKNINYYTKSIVNTENIIPNTPIIVQAPLNTFPYTRSEGLVITNSSTAPTTNPSLIIKSNSESQYPYFIIENNIRSYYLNINNDNLQLSTKIQNDINGVHYMNEGYNTGYRPCVFQHINQGNIFSIGTQGTVNIECKTTEVIPPSSYTNHELHTSIGLPYYDEYFVANQNNRNNSVGFFKQKILNSVETPESDEALPEYIQQNEPSNVPTKDYLNEYTLNIFGNVRIANTSNHSMISVKDGDIRIADKNNVPIFRIENGKLYIDCDTHFSKNVFIKNTNGLYKKPTLNP